MSAGQGLPLAMKGYKKKTRYLKLTEYYEGFPRLLQMGLRTQGRKQDGCKERGDCRAVRRFRQPRP